MSRVWHIRAAIATLIGIFAVHQGRYLFAPPSHKHDLSAAHSYLTWLGPVAAVLAMLALVQLLSALGREPGTPARMPKGRPLWLGVTVTLLHAFAAQECLETFFTHGQVPSLVELFGSGGWTAIPIAIAAGGVIALLLKGAARVVRWAIARKRTPERRPRILARTPRPVVLAAPRSVLARRLAGRGPPVLA